MEEQEPTPQAWIKGAWRDARLEVLVPVALGVSVAQFMVALFALRSYHDVLLTLATIGSCYALLRAAAFLYRLSRDTREGVQTVLRVQDLLELFAPLILSVGLYGMIAPNYRLALFFALMALPHLLLLAYLGRRYGILTTPRIEPRGVPDFVAHMVQLKLILARVLRKIPDFRPVIADTVKYTIILFWYPKYDNVEIE